MFVTSSLDEAAFLSSQGHSIMNTQSNGEKVGFCFEPNCEAIIHDWRLNPTAEMRLTQAVLQERIRLVRYIKEQL